MSAPPDIRPSAVAIAGPIRPGYDRILTPQALDFLAALHGAHGGQREVLLDRRRERQAAFEAGVSLTFPPETESIRTTKWTCAPIPRGLQDRRVEIA